MSDCFTDENSQFFCKDDDGELFLYADTATWGVKVRLDGLYKWDVDECTLLTLDQMKGLWRNMMDRVARMVLDLAVETAKLKGVPLEKFKSKEQLSPDLIQFMLHWFDLQAWDVKFHQEGLKDKDWEGSGI